MPSACFDAIRNVSTTWKHAKGMSLRYGVNLSAVMVYKMAASRSLKGCDAVFVFCRVIGVGDGGYFFFEAAFGAALVVAFFVVTFFGAAFFLAVLRLGGSIRSTCTLRDGR